MGGLGGLGGFINRHDRTFQRTTLRLSRIDLEKTGISTDFTK